MFTVVRGLFFVLIPSVPAISIQGKFHQHSMRSVYARRSQKQKKRLTTCLNFLQFWDLCLLKLLVKRWLTPTYLCILCQDQFFAIDQPVRRNAANFKLGRNVPKKVTQLKKSQSQVCMLTNIMFYCDINTFIDPVLTWTSNYSSSKLVL